MADFQVKRTDLQLSTNKKAHRTDAYNSSELIVRRGQEFSICLKFSDGARSKNTKNILLIAETGPSPSDSKKTRAIIPISSSKLSNDSWYAKQKYDNCGGLSLTVSSSVSAVIGRYTLSVQVTDGATNQIFMHSLGSFILLFNPWIPGDEVYMPGESERNEYVLNDQGIQFSGNEHEIVCQEWCYCQFEKDVLEICLSILDQSNNHRRNPAEDVSHRNNPVYICRVLAAMVNSQDDRGVLMENWSGDYADGVAPIHWKGSVEILQKWHAGGHKPVRYGQCFVFGGVMCTVLRSIGIPCRSVTNYNSAQDKDGNLYIDVCYDGNGGDGDTCKDVLWNYHVWNEAWFARKDLGTSYDGWQAIDATPLEKSEGMYRCGPASIKAIKEGDVDKDYDTRFMFASVNADVAMWIAFSDGTRKKVNNNTRRVGKCIVTKAINGTAADDITDTYKYREGSMKEREVFKKATSKLFEGGPMAERIRTLAMTRAAEQPSRDPQLTAEFQLLGFPKHGEDIKLTLSLSNHTTEDMLVKVHISSSSILYTRSEKHVIWQDLKEVHFAPKEDKPLSVIITRTQYTAFLSDDRILKVVAVCEVPKTDERVVAEKLITLGTASTCSKLVPRRKQ
ncbi:protein-glutamine gamma-glutamyltransferase 6-like [Ambystoma mexicanum]|uniref:protein-glutamine gamma-glutamyltransferase 6-like n=1 Tax=Ambystoma mexicanum TaxID=8296 RepID=UPI0037E89BC3